MPSPFPGMNPYLEQHDLWQDFHDRFVPALSDALSPQVSPHFIVKIEEHIYIHEPSAEQRFRLGGTDVGIIRPGGQTAVPGGVSTLQRAPAKILLPSVEIDKQTFLEVRDRLSRELVTVIEVLSPTNKKPGPDREQYLTKRAVLLRGTAHFVEIDLLRGWPRMPYEQAQSCDYCLMVSQADDRPKAGFWPLSLRDPLPNLPIPLRPPLAEVYLDLQNILHQVYDRAFYKDHIYGGSPQPPLSPDDNVWAQVLAKSAMREDR